MFQFQFTSSNHLGMWAFHSFWRKFMNDCFKNNAGYIGVLISRDKGDMKIREYERPLNFSKLVENRTDERHIFFF